MYDAKRRFQSVNQCCRLFGSILNNDNVLKNGNVVLGTCINKTFAKGLVCIVFHQLQISLVKTLCLKCNDLLNMSVGRWRESVTITVKKKAYTKNNILNEQ